MFSLVFKKMPSRNDISWRALLKMVWFCHEDVSASLFACCLLANHCMVYDVMICSSEFNDFLAEGEKRLLKRPFQLLQNTKG